MTEKHNISIKEAGLVSDMQYDSNTYSTVLPDAESRIAALAHKARQTRKNSATLIDWGRRAAPPVWMPKRLAASAISQFRQGEIATARMCTDMTRRVQTPGARDFLTVQAEDERRHANIYSRYLEKLGGADPGPSSLERTYDRATSWGGAPEGIILVCHTIFERESLQLQNAIDRWMPCPLFKDISAIIARDEARHVAFGKIYLRDALPHLPHRERLDMYRWTRALWFEAVRDAISRFAPPGIVRAYGGLSRWMADEWDERVDELEALHLFTPEERKTFVQA